MGEEGVKLGLGAPGPSLPLGDPDPAGIIVSVDPDTYPDGTPIPDGTVINQVYHQAYGVTLSAFGTIVVANQVCAHVDALASTGPSVFGFWTGQGVGDTWFPGAPGTPTDAFLGADFDIPTDWVAIDIIGNDTLPYLTDIGQMDAYNSADELVGTVVSSPLFGGEFETISITRPTADISYVIISGGPFGIVTEADNVHLDRLQFAQESAVCVDDSNTTGVEDGTSEHPFNTIQEGINAVADGGVVRVARGTYTGDLTINGKKVTIKGGYAGGTNYATTPGDFGEANRDADPLTNQTVVDGGGAAIEVTCQDAAAEGSAVSGIRFRNGGAIFKGVIRQGVITQSN